MTSSIKKRKSFCEDFYHQPTTSVKIISTASLNSKSIKKVKRLYKMDSNFVKQSSIKNDHLVETEEGYLIDSCDSDEDANDFVPLKKSTVPLRQYTKNKEDKAVIKKQQTRKQNSKKLLVKTETKNGVLKPSPKHKVAENKSKMLKETNVNRKTNGYKPLSDGKLSKVKVGTEIYNLNENSNSKQNDTKNDVQNIPNKRKRKKTSFDSNFITPTLTVKKRKQVQPTLKQTLQKKSAKDSLDKQNKVNGCVGSIRGTKVNLEEIKYTPTKTHKVFLEVIDTIMSQKEDWKHFEGEDARAITNFKCLQPSTQDLYAHLYQRKQEWVHENKLAFFTQKDLKTETDELLAKGFLVSSKEKGSIKLEIDDILDLMNKDMLTKLCKWLNFSYKTKEQTRFLVNKCLNNSKQSSSFFQSKTADFKTRLFDRMLMIIGTCYFVVTEKRKAFDRCQLVYHSVRSALQESSVISTLTGKVKVVNRRPGQLTNMLLNNMGKVIYPKYEVFVKNSMFHNRDELIAYEQACSKLDEMYILIDSSNYNEAIVRCEKYFDDNSSEINNSIIQASIPRFARRCTAPYIQLKIQNLKIVALEKLKRYSDANKHIQELLNNYKSSSLRGHWYNRLVINYSHLRDAESEKNWLNTGIDDLFISESFKIELQQRYNKLFKKKDHNIHITDMNRTQPQSKAPVVEINGVYLSKHMQSKSMQFIRFDGADTIACSVEELAVLHYRDQGFPHGIHKEGATFMTLLGLLMWDIIYLSGVPNVFRHKYQTLPLDFMTEDFYKSRKSQIDKRISLIQKWNSAHFNCEEHIKNVWNTNYKVNGGCVSWDIFNSPEQAVEVAVCMGSNVLSGVIKRILCCPGYGRSGLPDLFVWNPKTGKSKIVEVKAPSDRLSSKQEVWIHALLNLGANVNICKIVAKREAV